jgi:uncharacterized membrane protein (UPF0127 family)
MKGSFVYTGIAVVGIVAIMILVATTVYPDHTSFNLIIQGKSYEISQIETTPAEWQQGLMNQTVNNGTLMLFVYPRPRVHEFWIMNMRFSLDIIWMNVTNGEGTIIYQVKSVPVCSIADQCGVYGRDIPSNFVLEAVPGFIQDNNLSVGMPVFLQEKS